MKVERVKPFDSKLFGNPHILPDFAEVAIPLEIHRIEQEGGITSADVEFLRESAMTMAEEGDVLLFRVKRRTAPAFTRFVRCVALLAFWPGGVEVFGVRYTGEPAFDSGDSGIDPQQIKASFKVT